MIIFFSVSCDYYANTSRLWATNNSFRKHAVSTYIQWRQKCAREFHSEDKNKTSKFRIDSLNTRKIHHYNFLKILYKYILHKMQVCIQWYACRIVKSEKPGKPSNKENIFQERDAISTYIQTETSHNYPHIDTQLKLYKPHLTILHAVYSWSEFTINWYKQAHSY